mgnify:CR=1 FL=1
MQQRCAVLWRFGSGAPPNRSFGRAFLPACWWERFLPEAGAAAIALFAGFPVSWGVVLLPCLIRLLILGSVGLHGFGHAVAAGRPWRRRFFTYAHGIPLRSLLPFQPIFLPGVTPSSRAPRMSLNGLSPARSRWSALCGPAANAALLSCLVPASVILPVSPGLLHCCLIVLAGVNLWILMCSWSDYATILSGIDGHLYCGNFGILAKRLPNERGFLPARFERLAKRLGEETDIRGQQAGGMAVLSEGRGFVGRKIVNDKRGNLTGNLLRAFRRRALRDRLLGSRPLRKIFHLVAHYRYGTSSAPSEGETHWHRWMRPRTRSVWCVDGTHLTRRKQVVDNLITHNGDFDAWLAPFGRLDYPCLGQWLTDVLGERNLARGDSAKIAGIMDLLVTQGQWDASLRLAYALQTGNALPGSSLRDLPRLFEKLFKERADSALEPERGGEPHLTVAGCGSLAEVFARNPVAVKQLVDGLRQAALSATRDWPEEAKRRRQRFISQAVQAFFCNDLSEATRLFMERAEGTFGLVSTTSLRPGAVALAADRQPLYVGTDPEAGLLVYASVAGALKVAGRRGQAGEPTPLPYRFDLRDGDVVLLQVREDTADNTMTVMNRYSSNPPVTTRIIREYLAESAQDADFRGWIALSANPYFEPPPLENQANRVLAEMTDIPPVLDRIQRDWDDPASLNRRTAAAFGAALLKNGTTFSTSGDGEDAPRLNAELDLLLLGVENNLYLAEQLAQDLRRVFPYLHVEAVDAVSYCEDPQRFGLGPATTTLAVSHSGQTFNTVDAVKFVQALHALRKAGPVFVMTGAIDTLLGAEVGQSVKAGAAWRNRVFTTGAGWRTAEPATVSSAATHATLTQLLLRVAHDAQERSRDQQGPFGLAANEEDLRRLDALSRLSVSRAAALFDRTAEGWEITTAEHSTLLREGKYLSRLLTEPAIAFMASALHLFVMLWLGWNPVIGAQAAIATATGWAFFDTGSLIGSLILVALQTAYFLFAGVAFTLLLRWFQGRPLWDRVFVGRTLVIGDVPYVKNLLAQYVSKLFSQAYEFTGFAAIHAADPRSGDLLHVYGHRITRGLLLFIGFPDGRWPGRERAEAAVGMTCSQARSVKSMGTGATVLGMGHNPASATKVDRFLLLGVSARRAEALPSILRGSWSEVARDLQESRFASFERLLAAYVVFHSAAATTRDFMNRLVPLANLVWMPVFWSVRLLTRGGVRPRFGYWDLARTQSGTRIATTAAPVPAITSNPSDYLTPVTRSARVCPPASRQGDVIPAVRENVAAVLATSDIRCRTQAVTGSADRQVAPSISQSRST